MKWKNAIDFKGQKKQAASSSTQTYKKWGNLKTSHEVQIIME